MIYSVDAATRLPVRIETRVASGKPSAILEIREWDRSTEPIVRQMIFHDSLRKVPDVTLDLVKFEKREIPAALFDVSEGHARLDLPAPLE